jgi:SH3-like domain-containing protein
MHAVCRHGRAVILGTCGSSELFDRTGTEVQILETRDEWTRIRLSDGRDAWLPRSALALVEP